MRRLGFGLLLVGLAVTARAAPPEDFFVSEPDLLTIRSVRSNTGQLPPYRSSASVIFIHPVGTAHVGLGFSSTSRWNSIPDPKKETRWASTAHWQLISISGNGRAALAPLPLNETKGELLEISPQRHSIWMVWRKALP